LRLETSEAGVSAGREKRDECVEEERWWVVSCSGNWTAALAKDEDLTGEFEVGPEGDLDRGEREEGVEPGLEPDALRTGKRAAGEVDRDGVLRSFGSGKVSLKALASSRVVADDASISGLDITGDALEDGPALVAASAEVEGMGEGVAEAPDAVLVLSALA
jgi:hypothetical protein